MDTVEHATASYAPEAGLISAILKSPGQYEMFHGIITQEDFHWRAYGWVWDAFGRLYEQGLRIDQITTGDELQRKDQLNGFTLSGQNKVFTGRAALSRLRDVGESQSAESYARQVKDYSAKRKYIEVFERGAYWSMNGRNADDIKNDIAKRMEEITTWNGQAAKHTQSISDAVSEAYDHTERAARGDILCVPTELIDLDKLLSGGMYAPGFYIIAGRPGQGKSAFLSTIAKNSSEKGKRIVIFSLEMANREIAQRLLAMESGIPTDRQRSGKLLDDEWPAYTHAIEVVAALPIVMNDLPAISPGTMRRVLRSIGEFDLVIVDYIQLQSTDERRDKRYLEVDEVSKGLKAIAKEFDRPVLAAAQLSRAVEQRANKKPVLSDLRESGSLEQDSDVVMFIYKDDDKPENITNLVVAKHRNGPVGTVQLVYRPTLTKFENAAKY